MNVTSAAAALQHLLHLGSRLVLGVRYAERARAEHPLLESQAESLESYASHEAVIAETSPALPTACAASCSASTMGWSGAMTFASWR